MAGKILKTRFEYGDDITGIADTGGVEGARLVKLAAGGKGTQGKPKVTHTTTATDAVVGAANKDRAVGEDVGVTRRSTVMLLEAHAALTENQKIQPAAAGRVAPDDAATAGRNLLGIALHAVGSQGQMVWCLVDFSFVK